MTKSVAQAPVRSASPARSRKLEVIEPFETVRMRRIRKARLYRLALGLSLGLIVFAGIGGVLS